MNGEGKNKKISILGCGWLGFPMAKLLVAKGWQVKGSTTTFEKLKLLQEAGIEPFLIRAEAENLQAEPEFFDSEFLLINIPPGRKTVPNFYLSKIKSLWPYIEASSIRKVIFISSTSVYGDVCREVTEADEADNSSELSQAEMLFLSAKNLNTTVIRFGGLFGSDRNPGRFFRDKNSIPNGLVPVNLIHLQDCLGLIEAILNQPKTGIYNAVAPSHPTKAAFYTKAIENMGLAAPEFVAEKTEWKIINADKIMSDLNYQFYYPDLLACLDDPAAF
ncbi:MAG: SDR family oxidoreductase [Janthinobacterium lividum]